MFNYNSITLNPTSDINIDFLNQMVLNDAANEQMRLVSLEPPLAFALMDNNNGSSLSTPGPDTSKNALYFAKNTTTGVTLNIDNVINSPLSVQVTVDRPGIYRFYVVAHMSSGTGNCVPSFQITDIDTNIVQEIGGFITTGTQSSGTGHFYTPSILFVDRWLYGGKTYQFTITSGLLGTDADIAYINAYKFPAVVAYFWVQGYNGSGQQIEIPNLTVPSFGIDIPNFEIPNFDISIPDFDFPDISIPDFDFGDIGGINLPDIGFDPEFPFGDWDSFIETFDKGTGAGLGPVFTWSQILFDPTPREYVYPGDNSEFVGGSAASTIQGTVGNAAGTQIGARLVNNANGNPYNVWNGFTGGVCDQGLHIPDTYSGFTGGNPFCCFVEFDLPFVPDFSGTYQGSGSVNVFMTFNEYLGTLVNNRPSFPPHTDPYPTNLWDSNEYVGVGLELFYERYWGILNGDFHPYINAGDHWRFQFVIAREGGSPYTPGTGTYIEYRSFCNGVNLVEPAYPSLIGRKVLVNGDHNPMITDINFGMCVVDWDVQGAAFSSLTRMDNFTFGIMDFASYFG